MGRYHQDDLPDLSPDNDPDDFDSIEDIEEEEGDVGGLLDVFEELANNPVDPDDLIEDEFLNGFGLLDNNGTPILNPDDTL